MAHIYGIRTIKLTIANVLTVKILIRIPPYKNTRAHKTPHIIADTEPSYPEKHTICYCSHIIKHVTNYSNKLLFGKERKINYGNSMKLLS